MEDFGTKLLRYGSNNKARSVIINFSTGVNVDVEFYQGHRNENRQYTPRKFSKEDYNVFAKVGEISIRIADKLRVQAVYDSETNMISFNSNSINDENIQIACNILSTILTCKKIKSNCDHFCEKGSTFWNYIHQNPELWELRDKFYNSLINSKHKLIEICMLDARNTIINSRVVRSANYNLPPYFEFLLEPNTFEDFLIKNDDDLPVAQTKEIKLRIIQPTFQGNSQWYGYFTETPTIDKKIDTSFNDYFVDPNKEIIFSEISKDLDAICKIDSKYSNYSDYYDREKSKNINFSIPTDPKELDASNQLEIYQKEIRPLKSSGESKKQGKSTQNNYEENKIFLKKIKDENLCFNITSLIKGDLDIYLKTRNLDDESYALKRSKSLKLQYAYEITKVTDYTYIEKNGKENHIKIEIDPKS